MRDLGDPLVCMAYGVACFLLVSLLITLALGL